MTRDHDRMPALELGPENSTGAACQSENLTILLLLCKGSRAPQDDGAAGYQGVLEHVPSTGSTGRADKRAPASPCCGTRQSPRRRKCSSF